MPERSSYRSSARRLPLRANSKIWDKEWPKPKLFTRGYATEKSIPGDGDEEDLQPGWEQLHSYYTPALVANPAHSPYTIIVDQTITAKDNPPLPLHSEQTFNVTAPLYSLATSEIHTIYPNQGDAVKGSILPHIVLTNPHLPWEQVATSAQSDGRNTVPWLALLCFDRNELTLQNAQLAGDTKIFPRNVTQSNTLSISLTLDEIHTMTQQPSIISPVTDDSTDPALVDFIFMQTDLFAKHVTAHDSSNGAVLSQSTPDVDRYKYLAHARAINTAGMADADVQQNGLFSIVVAHRTGAWDSKESTPIVVHLVSIVGVEKMAWPLAAKPYVALCSLYSWTYQCLPPDPIDIVDELEHLGEHKEALRIAKGIYELLLNSAEPLKQRVGLRMQDGFTLTRYRVQCGEETVAFYRGPFTPTIVPPSSTRFQVQSNCSTDLQVLDQQLGIMDISYSAAWQLGKMLAVTDQAFTAALSRVRNAIKQTAMQECKKKVLGPRYLATRDAISNLPAALSTLKALPSMRPPRDSHSSTRWHRPPLLEKKDLSFWSADVQAHFQKAANVAALRLAQAREGGFYNEQNTGVSSDWALVLQWVLDRMFLIGLPAQYYVSDPAALPPESLKFFSIDTNWVDALVDGALSLGNTIESDTDLVRMSIKSTIATYLDTIDPTFKHKPQLPTFGFLLRSDVVKQYPDLVIDAPYTTEQNTAPILRHEVLDTGVMLVLFDRTPGSSEFQSITLTQPPHQLRFAAGYELGFDTDAKVVQLKMEYQRICTETQDLKAWSGHCGSSIWSQGDTSKSPVFDFDSRLLIVPTFITTIYDNLLANNDGNFKDALPTAAMAAIQLNDPIYRIEISPHAGQTAHTWPQPKMTIKMPRRSRMVDTYKAWNSTMQHERPTAKEPEASAVCSLAITTPMPHWLRVTSCPPREKKPETLGFIREPLFNYSMYPLGGSRIGAPIPTKPYSQDIVFSVQLPESERTLGDFNLQELCFMIPMGSLTDTTRINFTESYDGPGPTMLSNLRFNVKCQVSSEPGPEYLLLRVLPRTTTGALDLRYLDEASFVWPMVEVDHYDGTSQLTVDVEVHEFYDNRDRSNPYIKHFPVQLDPTS